MQLSQKRTDIPIYSKDNLPKNGWKEYYACNPLQMKRMIGPFKVRLKHGAIITCQDGFIAVDLEGNPFPISIKEFISNPGEVRDFSVGLESPRIFKPLEE
jgi:hypothetical protein